MLSCALFIVFLHALLLLKTMASTEGCQIHVLVSEQATTGCFLFLIIPNSWSPAGLTFITLHFIACKWPLVFRLLMSCCTHGCSIQCRELSCISMLEKWAVSVFDKSACACDCGRLTGTDELLQRLTIIGSILNFRKLLFNSMKEVWSCKANSRACFCDICVVELGPDQVCMISSGLMLQGAVTVRQRCWVGIPPATPLLPSLALNPCSSTQSCCI